MVYTSLTHLEQTTLNSCLPLTAPYKRLITALNIKRQLHTYTLSAYNLL